MILKIVILVLVFAALSLVLFFLSCSLSPAEKEQNEIKDNMVFTSMDRLLSTIEKKAGGRESGKSENNEKPEKKRGAAESDEDGVFHETDERLVLSEYGIYQIQGKSSRFSKNCFKIWRYCYKLIKK